MFRVALGVVLVLTASVLYVKTRFLGLSDHRQWMNDVEIITVMGYISHGDQRPVQQSETIKPMHVHTQQTEAIVENIKDGDIIVILRPTLPILLSILDEKTPSFTLVSVNYDDPVTPQIRDAVCRSQSVTKMYAQNLQNGACDHKILPLPLGLNHHKYSEIVDPRGVEQSILEIRRSLSTGELKKKPRILVTELHRIGGPGEFSERLNDSRPVRTAYVEDLLKLPFVDKLDRIPFDEYLSTMASYQFVLSPPGNGYDCFRTWEALSVGTIPIVHDDGIHDIRLFDGTPVWITNSTEEVRLNFHNRIERSLDVTPQLPPYLTLDNWYREFKSHITR